MAAGDTLLTLGAADGVGTATNGATHDTRNEIFVLDFDGSTDEEAVWHNLILPRHYGGGGIDVIIHAMCSSATSGTFRWQTSFEAGSGQDHDSDGFATANSGGGSANATSGIETVVTISHTNGAQIDSVAAGGAFRLKVRRDADGTSGTDDITTDVELISIELRETP